MVMGEGALQTWPWAAALAGLIVAGPGAVAEGGEEDLDGDLVVTGGEEDLDGDLVVTGGEGVLRSDLEVTGGEVRSCRGPDDLVDLGARLGAAEEALAAVDFSGAIALLQPLESDLACFATGVDPPSLARGAFLLGYARFEAGDRPGARIAFGMAAVFDPQIAWDRTFPPDAQQEFNDAVLAALRVPPAQLTRGDQLQGTLEIDGLPREGPAEIPAGWHHVALRAPDGGAVLRRAVHFPAEGRVALGTEVVEEALEEAFVAGTPAVAARPPPGPILVVAGSVAAAVGIVVGISQRERALGVFGEVEADPDRYDTLEQPFEQARGASYAGWVVAGVGGVAIAVGVPLWIGSRPSQPGGPEATSLRVRWRCDDGETVTAELRGRW